MGTLRSFLNGMVARLDSTEYLARLLVRVSVGVMFFESGWRKLGNLEEFTRYFEGLGIPAAGLQAPLVAATELLAGALVVVGLATRAASAALAAIMVVAMATARLREAKVATVGDFLYLNEWLLLLLLVWLVFAGAGRLSVDARLARPRR